MNNSVEHASDSVTRLELTRDSDRDSLHVRRITGMIHIPPRPGRRAGKGHRDRRDPASRVTSRHRRRGVPPPRPQSVASWLGLGSRARRNLTRAPSSRAASGPMAATVTQDDSSLAY